MSVSNKIKSMIKAKGLKGYDLAEYFGISHQAFRNKLNRDSFSAEDLIKVAHFLGYELAFISDTQKTILDLDDIKAD